MTILIAEICERCGKLTAGTCPSCPPETPTGAPKPLAAQLDLDGRAHEIAPQTPRMRLFDPAPNQLAGQTDLLADIERKATP